MQRLVSGVVVALALAGCFKITAADGALTCASTNPPCPENYYCAGDNHCWHNGRSPDADMSAAASGDPCNDGVKDGDETDIDCAGACAKRCADGQGCVTGSDCASGTCNAKTMICAGQCSDGVRDGNESDVDCGGSCSGCVTGKACGANADCASMLCNATAHLCVSDPCQDGIKDGTESDVDCGGTCATKCRSGLGCNTPADCMSNTCTSGKCFVAHCSDTNKNYDETDVDCGGPTCGPCATGKMCLIGSDCSSTFCNSSTHQCVASSCQDGVKDGTESDVDCGGTCPNRCGENKVCSGPSDCAASATCDTTTSECCTPTATTCPSGQTCGTFTNNCHQTSYCGANMTAGCADTDHFCNSSLNKCCLTMTASCSGKQCGNGDDGCGNATAYNCGGCGTNQACDPTLFTCCDDAMKTCMGKAACSTQMNNCGQMVSCDFLCTGANVCCPYHNPVDCTGNQSCIPHGGGGTKGTGGGGASGTP